MTDARFEDGREAPLNLGAMDADDLSVISSLVQDAVFPSSEMRWDAKNARFAILLNRFRWEEGPARATRPERVQSVLSFQTVRGVASNGIDRSDKDLVLSVLSVSFEPGEDPSGYITITLAGDGAIRLDVEAVDVALKDVTKPYNAPSGQSPSHPD